MKTTTMKKDDKSMETTNNLKTTFEKNTTINDNKIYETTFS